MIFGKRREESMEAREFEKIEKSFNHLLSMALRSVGSGRYRF